MKIFLSVVITIIVIIIAGLIYIFSGTYDVSAANKDRGLSRWVLETTMENSVAHHAKDIQVPSNLGDSAYIWTGFNHYVRMCGCHGGPDRMEESRYNPPAPKLTQAANHWKPNELFWIVKNGIKMSAMPPFGNGHNDEDIWHIVAFLEKFPDMSEEQYNDRFQKAREQMMNERMGGGNFPPKHEKQ
jgi:cytochrome c553